EVGIDIVLGKGQSETANAALFYAFRGKLGRTQHHEPIRILASRRGSTVSLRPPDRPQELRAPHRLREGSQLAFRLECREPLHSHAQSPIRIAQIDVGPQDPLPRL